MDLKYPLCIRNEIDPTHSGFVHILMAASDVRTHVSKQLRQQHIEGLIEDKVKETVGSWILALKLKNK